MLLLIWIIYFFTDVYGHIALKMAARASSIQSMLLSVWGISAVGAWLISGLAWMLVLARHPLLTANTIASFTYILISISAVVIFHEPLTTEKLLGILLVCAGIYLVVR